MKVGIIGAGFTGLSAAYQLSRSGHQVMIFEKLAAPGGLAMGFKDKAWAWSLEAHYHHLFTSDHSIITLAQEMGVKIDFYRPKTSTYIENTSYQLDSPQSLLKFPKLNVTERLRTGIGLASLRFNLFWQPLEAFTAKDYLTRVMGEKSWRLLWEPLFMGKFGKYADQISAAWFWARIYKRSPSLGYPEGGFQNLANKLSEAITQAGGRILYKQDVSQINSDHQVKLSDGSSYRFDAVICTLPFSIYSKITVGLPPDYISNYSKTPFLGAVNLVLGLKRQFLTNGTYWLNINDRSHPYLAVVEHTNLVNLKNYNNDHLLYIGNYLPSEHQYFQTTPEKLLDIFLPYLQKINPDFSVSWVRKIWLHKAPFAQPVITRNYSRLIPPIQTPIPGIYLANMQQVYPWDRGTNYAVELGEKVAGMITL